MPLPLGDLQVDASADHVAAGEVLHRGGVALHEPLAGVVDEEAALAAHRLGEEEAQLVHPGRMELEELHVLERQPAPIRDRHAVAGQGVRVRGDLEDLAVAAGGEEDGPCPEGVELGGRRLEGDDPGDRPVRPVGKGDVEHLVLVEEGDLVADALLEEGLEDGVAGPVGGEAGATHRPLAVVAGVAAESALVDEPLGSAVEGKPEVLEVDDRVDGVPAHHLGRVLVDEVVAALDRVEPVPLPVVLLGVAECGAHPALGGSGVRARGVELADDADAGLGPELLLQLERGVEARAARADDDGIHLVNALGRDRPAGRW